MRDVVVLTRSAADNAQLAHALRGRGVTVIELPALSVEATDVAALARAVRALDRDDWLVFTSRAAVDAARGAVSASEIRARVAAIGRATAARCAEWGIAAWTPTSATGVALGRELPVGAGVVLLARAERADPAAARELRARGARVREVVAYRAVAGVRGDPSAARAAALQGAVVVVASPATFEAVAAALGPDALTRARVLTIGPTTARAAARALGVEPRILPELTAEAIVREMEVLDVAHA